MPFESKAQMKAAFSGALGPEMQSRAETWAHETPNIRELPEHVRSGSESVRVHSPADHATPQSPKR